MRMCANIIVKNCSPLLDTASNLKDHWHIKGVLEPIRLYRVGTLSLETRKRLTFGLELLLCHRLLMAQMLV